MGYYEKQSLVFQKLEKSKKMQAYVICIVKSRSLISIQFKSTISYFTKEPIYCGVFFPININFPLQLKRNVLLLSKI